MFFLSIVHHRIERSNHPLLNKFGKLFFFLSRTRLESVLILFANPMLSRLLFIATFSFHSRKLVVAKFTLSYWTWNMSFHHFLIHLCKRGTRASGYLTSLAFFKPDLSFNYTSQHVLKTFYFLHDQCNCPYLYMLLKKKKKAHWLSKLYGTKIVCKIGLKLKFNCQTFSRLMKNGLNADN